MRDERSQRYELLGVAPGASAEELKAAHRDLVKVWHPDRFAHDPRLRQKAQEKLKEINEAYDLLTSKRPPGRTPPGPGGSAPRAGHAPEPPRPTAPSRGRWPLVLLAACVCGAVFFVAFRSPAPRGASPAPAEGRTAKQEAAEAGGRRNAAAAPATEPPARDRKPAECRPAEASGSSSSAAGALEVRALPTVTLLIDPTTGLLATRDCPVRSRTNYAAGSEPRRHCDAHAK